MLTFLGTPFEVEIEVESWVAEPRRFFGKDTSFEKYVRRVPSKMNFTFGLVVDLLDA